MKKKYIKILTGGDGGVGKTTLLHRFIKGEFSPATKMTEGIQFFMKEIQLDKNNVVILNFWDMGGERRFRDFLENYATGIVSDASAALLMFDLSRFPTISSLHEWIELCRHENPKLPILFLGTKLDKVKKDSIPYDVIAPIVEKHRLAGFLSTSSLTGENVEYSVEILLKRVLNYFKLFAEHGKKKKKTKSEFYRCPNCKNENIIDKGILIYCSKCELHFKKSDFGLVSEENMLDHETQDAILKGFDEFLPLNDHKKFFKS